MVLFVALKHQVSAIRGPQQGFSLVCPLMCVQNHLEPEDMKLERAFRARRGAEA